MCQLLTVLERPPTVQSTASHPSFPPVSSPSTHPVERAAGRTERQLARDSPVSGNSHSALSLSGVKQTTCCVELSTCLKYSVLLFVKHFEIFSWEGLPKNTAGLSFSGYPGLIKSRFMTCRLVFQRRPAAPLRMGMSLCIALQDTNATSSILATQPKESPTGVSASSYVEIRVSSFKNIHPRLLCPT